MDSIKAKISVILAMFALLLVCPGCDSRNDFVVTGNSITPFSNIRVTSVLARTIPAPVTDLRFTGLNTSGDPVFGPVTLTKASDILLETVPVTVTELQIEYLAGGVLVGRGFTEVSLQGGQTFTVNDPDFDIVFADQPLELSPSDPTIPVDSTLPLTAVAELVGGGTTDVSSLVDWSTESANVATVDTSGVVTAESIGATDVTATLSLGSFSIAGTTNLTVAPALTSVEVFPKDSLGTQGGSLQYRVLGTFSDGSTQLLNSEQVVWSVTNQGSAGASTNVSVSDSGLATIPESSAGGQKATVTAEMAGFSDSATLTLNSFVYLTAATLDDAFVYSRDTVDGTLTPLSVPSVNLGMLVTDPVYSPNGRLLFLTNGSSQFSMFTIGDDGLTVPNIDPSTSTNRVTVDNGINGAPTMLSGGAVDPRNQFLYIIDFNSGLVFTYQIGSDGLLTFLRESPRTGEGAIGARSMQASPDGRFLYVLTRDGDVETFAIQQDGDLERVSSVTTSADSGEFTVVPAGDRIYVNNDLDDLIYGFNVSENGILSPIINPGTGNNETATPPDQARELTATDEFLYVRLRSSGQIAMYRIEPNGVLTPNIDPGTGNNLFSASLINFTVGPTGRFLYFVSTQLGRLEIGEDGLLSNRVNRSIPSSYQILVSP